MTYLAPLPTRIQLSISSLQRVSISTTRVNIPKPSVSPSTTLCKASESWRFSLGVTEYIV